MVKTVKRLGIVMAFAAGFLHVSAGAASEPGEIIAASCGGCHAPDGKGGWVRISDQRKTPEGWQMTLVRMGMVHNAKLVDPAGGDSSTVMRTLVKHFADTQGLAPAESAPYRYILEQELNTVEEHPTEAFATMCARCHSGARVGLQRRTEDEWRHLVHFHLGQFPTTEYQMMGRDRDWLGLALNEMVPYLAEEFPLQSAAWEEWGKVSKPALDGRWRVYGTMPGKGPFSGVMVATDEGGDSYALEFSGSFLDGEKLSGSGTGIVYTGYEWRATLSLGDRKYRQVLAASSDGNGMAGRMFDRERSEWGLRLQAVRDNGTPSLVEVQPGQLPAGGEGLLRLVGTNLSGSVQLGKGLRIVQELARGPDEITLRVAAEGDVTAGKRAVAVGEARLEDALTVFSKIDRVEVEPAFAVARVGGDGGSQPVVDAMFDAVAWSNGADGEAGTGDDMRIGPVAAAWTVEPFNAQAESDQDVRFAGQMDKDSGVFTPAAAGPNPERKYQTNNAGNLKVVATVDQGEQEIRGEGQLIVTVQRWNNPPIR